MNINEALRLLAGIVTLLGIALGFFVSPWFYLINVFVGLNLIQSAFTKWCPAMWFLRMAGIKE